MAWVKLSDAIPGMFEDSKLRFATKRKCREYILRLTSDKLSDQHIVQLHHGCTEYKVNGKTYTSGHKIASAEFRGR
jgi:hypothetical protein